MPTDRLFRYSISGTMFILSFLFFIFFFGIYEKELQSLILERNLVMFIGLFLSTPVLGLIVSTLAFYFDYRRRRDVYYFIPNDPLIINYIFDQFPNLKKPECKEPKSKNPEDKKTESKNPDDWTDEYIDTFYPFYQIQVRKFITGLHMEYLERRLAVYWTNTNTIAGVFVALLIVLLVIGISMVVTFFTGHNKVSFGMDLNPFKIIGLVALAIYCRLAFIFRRRDLIQGKSFEEITLHKGIEEEKKNEYKESIK